MSHLKKAKLYTLVSSVFEVVAVLCLVAGWDSGLPLLSVLVVGIRWAVWLAGVVEMLTCFDDYRASRVLATVLLLLIQAPVALMYVETSLASLILAGGGVGLIIVPSGILVLSSINFAQSSE